MSSLSNVDYKWDWECKKHGTAGTGKKWCFACALEPKRKKKK